ncbi:MAG: hypothetical protein KDI33_19220 [Halioglobus sp.]|nr:hypothetical protein [Halioglobus sp.]
MKIRATFAGAVLFSFSLFAQANLINFDEPGITNPVDNFYAADGVIFQTGDWIVGNGFGQTSQPNFAFSSSGTGYMNIIGGFTNSLDFTYGAFVDSTVNIFDGLNGTGSILGSISLPGGNQNSFTFVSLGFSGTALSAAIVSAQNQFGWDDVQFSKGQKDIPIAATLPLLGLGLAALGYNRRKQKRYS